jgi:CHRD domain-containing protein
MRKLAIFVSLLAAAGVTLVAAAALADRGGGDDGNTFRAKLIGYQEVPAQSTPGLGSLRLRIVGGNTIHYTLHYEDFETAEGDTLFAHIHFGARSTNGGVAAFLCGGGDKPPCTPREGTFENDIDATDVIGPGGQGITSGEMAELLRAMRKGITYGNVHTTRAPGGLIRGQIGHGHGHKGN